MTSSGIRALRALQVVNASDEPLGVTAIAAALDTLPGTAYRSLDALERGEFVSRYRASSLYQIGATAIRLRQTLHAQFPLRNVAMPYLRRLALAANDTVSLTVPVGWHSLRLVAIAGSNSVRSSKATGLSGLLEETLAGRAILSSFDQKMMARYLEDAAPLLEVERRPRILIRALHEIAEQGFALEPVEGAGRSGIAMPVRHKGKVIGAISIDGPVVRTDGDADAGEIETWQRIVDEVELAVGQAKAFQATPFDHLDPQVVDQALMGHADIAEQED